MFKLRFEKFILTGITRKPEPKEIRLILDNGHF